MTILALTSVFAIPVRVMVTCLSTVAEGLVVYFRDNQVEVEQLPFGRPSQYHNTKLIQGQFSKMQAAKKKVRTHTKEERYQSNYLLGLPCRAAA